MPRYDGTGPNGQGAKTGRQLGNCEGAESNDYTGRGLGRGPCGAGLGRGFGRGAGMGRGCGRGFGWRNQTQTPLTPEQEKQILETQKGNIEKRLKELDS